jgi:hypothetical protein
MLYIIGTFTGQPKEAIMSNTMALNIIQKLRTKLARQEDAVAQTKAEIAMWEAQLQQTELPITKGK